MHDASATRWRLGCAATWTPCAPTRIRPQRPSKRGGRRSWRARRPSLWSSVCRSTPICGRMKSSAASNDISSRAQHRPLGHLNPAGRRQGESPRELSRRGGQLIGRHHPAHQPDGERRLRVDGLAAQDQVERIRQPHDARQEPRAAAARGQAQPDVDLAEPRRVGSQAEVGRARQVEARAVGRAVHGGDQHLGKRRSKSCVSWISPTCSWRAETAPPRRSPPSPCSSRRRPSRRPAPLP